MKEIALKTWVARYGYLKSRNMLYAATQKITFEQWNKNEARLNKLLTLKLGV